MPRPDFEIDDIVFLDDVYANSWFGGVRGPYKVSYVEDDDGDDFWYIGFTSLDGELYKEPTWESGSRRYSRAPVRHIRKDVFMTAVKEALKNA